jgi:ubiquinone/menaquinone biosynthesis C-methylase UbiE
MQRDWDQRARENALHYVATGRKDWTMPEFLESGRQTVAGFILSDMLNICRQRKPEEMRVLEIGCGAGRLTLALAELFGEVHAVDVSGEMVKLAREVLRERSNAFVYQNNGMDLKVLDDRPFDFAFSLLVFQHIPSKRVIEGYVREVSRLLRPGTLFKFQLQGQPGKPSRRDTWFGAGFSESEVVEMAERCNFEPRYMAGAGTQLFWVWCFKKS